MLDDVFFEVVAGLGGRRGLFVIDIALVGLELFWEGVDYVELQFLLFGDGVHSHDTHLLLALELPFLDFLDGRLSLLEKG